LALSPLPPIDTEGPDIIETDPIEQPLKTYELNLVTGELGGIINGEDAIRQFIFKAIRTARFRFAIYDDDYGCEIEDLIGQDVSTDLLESEVPRVIEEALIYDDRIDAVYGFELTREGDSLYVSFYVDVDDEVIPMEVTI